jgi:hypothetical protein
MPALNRHKVYVTIEYIIDGNDYASVIKLAEDHMQPALKKDGNPGYPHIAQSKISKIEISTPN